MRKSKFESDFMIGVVQKYLNGQSSQKKIADRLGIDKKILREWIRKYKSMGTEILCMKVTSIIPKKSKNRQ